MAQDYSHWYRGVPAPFRTASTLLPGDDATPPPPIGGFVVVSAPIRGLAASGSTSPPVFSGSAEVSSHAELLPVLSSNCQVAAPHSAEASGTLSFAFSASADLAASHAATAGGSNSTPPGGYVFASPTPAALAASGSASTPSYATDSAFATPRRLDASGGFLIEFSGDAEVAHAAEFQASGSSAYPEYGTNVSLDAPRTVAATGSTTPPEYAGSVDVSPSHPLLPASGSAGESPASRSGSLAAARRPAFASSGSVDFDRFIFRVVVNMVAGDEAQPVIGIRAGDVGLPFQAEIRTFDGRVLDVSRATLRKFRFQKPDRTLLEVDARHLTDGRDGLLAYDFAQGDLDQRGTWRFQAVLGFGADVKQGEIIKFKVNPNLPTES